MVVSLWDLIFIVRSTHPLFMSIKLNALSGTYSMCNKYQWMKDIKVMWKINNLSLYCYITDGHLCTFSKLIKKDILRRLLFFCIDIDESISSLLLPSLLRSLAVPFTFLYLFVLLISSNQKQICFFTSDNVQHIVFHLRVNSLEWTIGFLNFP